jgi:hypothetical protein
MPATASIAGRRVVATTELDRQDFILVLCVGLVCMVPFGFDTLNLMEAATIEQGPKSCGTAAKAQPLVAANPGQWSDAVRMSREVTCHAIGPPGRNGRLPTLLNSKRCRLL